MEYRTDQFEAIDSDDRFHTVLVYTTFASAGGASRMRLATADGLTVTAFTGGLYRTLLTGVWLARTGGAPAPTESSGDQGDATLPLD